MKLLKSFQYAFRGILSAIKKETNFRIHTVAAITVIIFSLMYGVDSLRAVILTLVVCLVLVAELINTAVEAMVDIICPQKNKLAQIAKDSAAGAVLVLAVGAIITAGLIFSDVERLLEVYKTIKANLFWLILYIILCVIYVFPYKRKKTERTNKL